MMFFYNRERTVINHTPVDNSDDFFYFYFHDKQFIDIDWSIEPSQSLADLYRARAEQIRNDHEYVIIPYSGGYKSSAILEAFYYNNIHIDEILMVGAFSQDSHEGSDENHNGEIYHQAIPTLAKMDLKHTKITPFDYSKHFDDPNNFSLVRDYGSEWIKYVGMYYSPCNLFWHDLKHFVGNDKKTAVVVGSNKPIIKDMHTYFPADNFYNLGNFQQDRVNFFTDPLTTDIIRKQLHTILKVVTAYGQHPTNAQFLQDNYSKIVNRLIYPLKNPITFESRKSPTNVLSLCDSFLTPQMDIYNLYRDSIKTHARQLYLFPRYENNFYSTPGSQKTQRYFLGND